MSFSLVNFIFQKKTIYNILHIVTLILSLFLVISISIDTFKGIAFYSQSSYMKVQLWICIWFLFNFFLELFMANRKWHYIRSRFRFFLIAIPYQNIIAYFHWTFSPELTYFLRFIPLVRGGYALSIVVGWLTYNKASRLLISYSMMLFSTIYFSSMAFYVIEHKVNPLVTCYGDAIWWAFMDCTTVGSDITAMTVTGKVLSVVLAALGMMMFPIFTVYITNMVQKANNREEQFFSTQVDQGGHQEQTNAPVSSQQLSDPTKTVTPPTPTPPDINNTPPSS